MGKARSDIEVPGESTADDQSTDAPEGEAPAAADAATAPQNPIDKTEPQENEEEAPVVAKSADPKANTPLDWSHLNGYQAMNADTPKDDPTANLPDMADVDPSTIPYARQVLTKQGWVVSTALDPNSARYAGK